MGVSVGLAGLGGCIRMPEEKLAPYARRPVGRSPGVPVTYATAMEIGGVAQGLLVTSVDGRPVKIEGNPLHPLNQGATDAIAQASILDLYDPDRSRGVIRRVNGERTESSWEEFARWAKETIPRDGSGLCILSEASSSPSLAYMRKRFKEAMPKLRWLEYEPVHGSMAEEGCGLFDTPLRSVLELSRAKVILAVDADLFGGGDPMAIKHARDFTRGRRAMEPEAISILIGQLAHALGLGRELGALESGVDKPFFHQLKADLERHAGNSAIAAGTRLSDQDRDVVRAINQRLGNIGKTVVYYPDPKPETPSWQIDVWAGLGQANPPPGTTLLILGGNPAYNGGRHRLREVLGMVSNSIHLAVHDDETSRLCDWHLPRTHYLESWGDARTYDGTVSVVQPLIEPLFDGRSAIEVLATMLGGDAGARSGYEIVRRTFRSLTGGSPDEWKWKKALADGVVEGTALDTVELEPWPKEPFRATVGREIHVNLMSGPGPDYGPEEPRRYPPYGDEDAPRLHYDRTRPEPLEKGVCDLVFCCDAKVYDGRFANNGWLQELPDPMTRLTWDNAALVSPKTAELLGVQSDDVVVLDAHDGLEARVPVLIQPGVADGIVGLALGYGRTAVGSVGNGVGQDAYRFPPLFGNYLPGVKVRPTGEKYKLATVQDHHVIDRVGKEAIRVRVPELVHEVTPSPPAPLPEGEGSPSPARFIFDEHRMDGGVAGQADQSQVPAHDRHRWGMAIDLSACTGCGACVVACQAENNIPIVGKEQVLHGREMHWIRVDRYFREEPPTPPSPPAPLPRGEGRVWSVHQPVPCMQCENAPCEEVCPFGATTHSQEGLNMMTYNRCVGTRYCSNNCPYKVRRFNFFDYNCGTLKDLYVPNLLRRPISELLRMQKNPDVTVRMRGVMEKCTYCIQRIEAARIAAKREGDRPIADGEIQTACQQVCPARAIVFGDLNDPASRVSQLHALDRSYGLLDRELNTKPRTRYLARVRNPAPGLDAELYMSEETG
jgi:molybdopterin-containing oxidoreductase family iron-sulfur binding subunit